MTRAWSTSYGTDHLRDDRRTNEAFLTELTSIDVFHMPYTTRTSRYLASQLGVVLCLGIYKSRTPINRYRERQNKFAWTKLQATKDCKLLHRVPTHTRCLASLVSPYAPVLKSQILPEYGQRRRLSVDGINRCRRYRTVSRILNVMYRQTKILL